MSQTTVALRVVLADVFSLYYKLHSAHWNTTGLLFHSLHGFFDVLYTEVWKSVDEIAEHIRTLDELAPASLTELLSHASLQENSLIPGTPSEMIQEIIILNHIVLHSLYSAHTASEYEKHTGITNFIESRIDIHAKHQWQLKAHLN
jgi:starvation-inducible DNA-binding protein